MNFNRAFMVRISDNQSEYQDTLDKGQERIYKRTDIPISFLRSSNK